jgi:hypothetical protein
MSGDVQDRFLAGAAFGQFGYQRMPGTGILVKKYSTTPKHSPLRTLFFPISREKPVLLEQRAQSVR